MHHTPVISLMATEQLLLSKTYPLVNFLPVPCLTWELLGIGMILFFFSARSNSMRVAQLSLAGC